MIANLLHRARLALVLAIVMGAAPWCAGAQAQTLEKLSIVIFSAPSLGAFMPPVIKAKNSPCQRECTNVQQMACILIISFSRVVVR